MRARLAEMFLQEFQALRPQIKGSENTKAFHLGGRCRANAVKPLHLEDFRPPASNRLGCQTTLTQAIWQICSAPAINPTSYFPTTAL
jgi:hypothetical protein